MTDIWVLLIWEPDWDSDRYLPGGEGAADAAEDFAEHSRFEQAITDAGERRRAVLTGLYALECDEQTARRLVTPTSGVVQLRKAFSSA